MAIRNVPKAYTFEEQRQEINLLSSDVGDCATLTTSSKIVVQAINAILDGLEAFDNLSITGDLTVQGGDIIVSNAATKLSIRDNTASAFSIAEATNNYLTIDTTNSAEKINLLKPVDITGGITVSGDAAFNGGDITTTSTGTATVFNTNATTLNVGGAATTVSIAASSGTTTVNNNLTVTGDLQVTGNDIKSSSATALTLSGANVTAQGTLGVTNSFSVATNKFTVDDVTGNTLVAGILDVTNNLRINTDKFTVASSTGNTSIAGTLGVSANFAVNTNKFTVAATTGNTSIAGTLGVTGDTTLTADLYINGSEINVAGATAGTSLLIKDNTASSFVITEGTNSYVTLSTINATEKITLHKNTDILGTLTNSSTLGLLTNLITDNKTTFVDAINEVKDDALIYAMLFG